MPRAACACARAHTCMYPFMHACMHAHNRAEERTQRRGCGAESPCVRPRAACGRRDGPHRTCLLGQELRVYHTGIAKGRKILLSKESWPTPHSAACLIIRGRGGGHAVKRRSNLQGPRCSAGQPAVGALAAHTRPGMWCMGSVRALLAHTGQGGTLAAHAWGRLQQQKLKQRSSRC